MPKFKMEMIYDHTGLGFGQATKDLVTQIVSRKSTYLRNIIEIFIMLFFYFVEQILLPLKKIKIRICLNRVKYFFF